MGNYRPGSPISVTGKVMEYIILKNLFKHKSKEVAGNSQQRFEKREKVLELIVFSMKLRNRGCLS